MERGQWDRAEQLLQEAVKACASDPDSRQNYAEALWQRGARSEAIKQIEEACRLAPDNPALHIRAAEMLLATNRVESAVRHTRRALDLDPRSPSSWAMRARIMQASGQLRDALASYHRALGYRPNDRTIQLEIAELYCQLEEPERALVFLQNVSESYSPGEEPQRLLYLEGLVYQRLGRHEEAIGCLSAAARRQPASPAIICRLGESLLAVGRRAEAAEAARESLRLDPQSEYGHRLLEWVELAQGRDETLRQ